MSNGFSLLHFTLEIRDQDQNQRFTDHEKIWADGTHGEEGRTDGTGGTRRGTRKRKREDDGEREKKKTKKTATAIHLHHPHPFSPLRSPTLLLFTQMIPPPNFLLSPFSSFKTIHS
jgi:hypothetical protein